MSDRPTLGIGRHSILVPIAKDVKPLGVALICRRCSFGWTASLDAFNAVPEPETACPRCARLSPPPAA